MCADTPGVPERVQSDLLSLFWDHISLWLARLSFEAISEERKRGTGQNGTKHVSKALQYDTLHSAGYMMNHSHFLPIRLQPPLATRVCRISRRDPSGLG